MTKKVNWSAQLCLLSSLQVKYQTRTPLIEEDQLLIDRQEQQWSSCSCVSWPPACCVSTPTGDPRGQCHERSHSTPLTPWSHHTPLSTLSIMINSHSGKRTHTHISAEETTLTMTFQTCRPICLQLKTDRTLCQHSQESEDFSERLDRSHTVFVST